MNIAIPRLREPIRGSQGRNADAQIRWDLQPICQQAAPGPSSLCSPRVQQATELVGAAGGKEVIGMKIVSASHVDHGLSQAQRDWLVSRFADRKAFFIESVELPSELGTVPCGLYGPMMGDSPVEESAAVYRKRGARSNESRLVNRPARPTKTVTVIAGPHDGLLCVMYTAFGGPLTPKEPGDYSITPSEQDESAAFWAVHALAV